MTIYRFYKIVSDKGELSYIGSTRQSIRRRYTDHIVTYHYKKRACCSSSKIFDLYGVESCRVELLEEVECETVYEARRIERRHQDDHQCVNQRRAIVSANEKRESNRVRAKEYMKTYVANKQQRLSPEEFSAFMEKRRLLQIEATKRWRSKTQNSHRDSPPSPSPPRPSDVSSSPSPSEAQPSRPLSSV
jgi:hypothetical protein